MKKLKNINWTFVALILCMTALISWRVGNSGDNNDAEDRLELKARRANALNLTNHPATTQQGHLASLKSLMSKTNHPKLDEYTYQISTNLDALPLEKRLFVTNNFIPAANQFLRQFPTQHHPIEAKDIKAVSVNYGVNGYVGVLTKIESDDGVFQILTQTVGGTNHIQSFRDLTDFDISVPGTVNDLKKTVTGSQPSVITTTAEAKAFVAALLQQYDFDFQNYLNPPVAVPYSALPNYGLWQVHYISKRAGTDQLYIELLRRL